MDLDFFIELQSSWVTRHLVVFVQHHAGFDGLQLDCPQFFLVLKQLTIITEAMAMHATRAIIGSGRFLE